MSALINMPRAAWKRQPRWPAKANLSSPVVLGLQQLWVNPGLIERNSVSGGITAASVGGIPTTASSFGVVPDYDGTNHYTDFGSSALLKQARTRWSFWIRPTSLAKAYSTLISCYESSLNYYVLYLKSNGKLASYVAGSSLQRNYDGTGAFTLAVNTWYHLVMDFRGVEGSVVYVNGVVDRTIPATNAFVPGAASVMFGEDTNTAGRRYTGQATNFAYFAGVSNPALQELYRDPYSLVAPAPSRFYLIPTDVALPTLSGATAINITSGGFQPRVTATY